MGILGLLKSLFADKESTDMEMLRSLLSNDSIRQDFLGFGRVVPPGEEQVLSDVNKVLRYAASSDYQVWAKEAWSHVLGCIDILSSSEAMSGPQGQKRALTQSEIDFHRGRLRQTLTLLSISYKAKAMQADLLKKVQAKELASQRRASVPQGNGN